MYHEELMAKKVRNKLKEDMYKAQRAYYLSQKLGDRVPECLKLYLKDNLDKYIRIAKNIDLKLTSEELYDRLFNK